MLPQSGDGLDVDGLLRWVAAVSRLSVSFGSPARRRPRGHPMSRRVGTRSRHTAPAAGRVRNGGGAGSSTSFLHGSSPRTQYPGVMLESARRTGKTKEEFTMMGWYGNGSLGSLGSLGMGVFWLILLGLIVWLVVRLLPVSGGGPSRNTGESALEVLDRRLANGQIDLEPWQAQRAALLGVQDDRK